jgi:hypothetical protein
VPTIGPEYIYSFLHSAHKFDYADNPGGTPVLLGTSSIGALPWMTWYGSRLWFFDLDQDPPQPFVGVNDDFFVAVFDDPIGGGFDIDAIQVVPEPSTALLVLAGGVFIGCRRTRCRQRIVPGGQSR